MAKRTELRPAAPRPGVDGPRPRVRHISSGDLGTSYGIDRPDAWAEWSLVRWDRGGPGMVDERGLSRVAPGLLARL